MYGLKAFYTRGFNFRRPNKYSSSRNRPVTSVCASIFCTKSQLLLDEQYLSFSSNSERSITATIDSYPFWILFTEWEPLHCWRVQGNVFCGCTGVSAVKERGMFSSSFGINAVDGLSTVSPQSPPLLLSFPTPLTANCRTVTIFIVEIIFCLINCNNSTEKKNTYLITSRQVSLWHSWQCCSSSFYLTHLNWAKLIRLLNSKISNHLYGISYSQP